MKIFDKQNFTQSIIKTKNNLWQSIPILIGILLLIGLLNNLISKNFYAKIFSQNVLADSFLGAIFGSIAAGNPITSYVVGGELLKEGISLIAVTAFLLTWVTVGIVQLPAESLMLGKKFAWTRNALSFISAIIISFLTWVILKFVL